MELDESYLNELVSADKNDFKQYDLSGRWILVKILNIHDGDTYTVGWKENDQLVKLNIRLDGLDTPELHSKNADEAKLCRLGRNWLISKYLNKPMVLQCMKMDKYGRLLANVFEYPMHDNVSINQMLIDNKFARVYGGDLHKNDWSNEEIKAGLAIAENLNIQDI